MLGMQSHSAMDMTCNGRESVGGRRQEMQTGQKVGTGKYHIQYAGQSTIQQNVEMRRPNKNKSITGDQRNLQKESRHYK